MTVGRSPIQTSPKASSPGGVTWESKISTILSKLPLPPPTGNTEKDSDAQAKHSILLKMCEHCLTDQSYILPLYQAFQEHGKKLLQDRVVNANYGENFQAISTLARLDEGFLINYLVGRSDLTAKDLAAGAKHNSDALIELLEFDTQLPPQLKLLPNLQIMEVCRRFLAQRSDEVGEPLRKFKAGGGLLMTGAINWKCGSYQLKSVNKRLAEVKFRNGDVAVVPPEHVTTDDYKLIRNFADWRSALERTPFPEIQLRLFFEQAKTGPYAATKQFGGRSKDYPALVETIYESWDAARKLLGVSVDTQEVVEAKEAISKVRTDKKKQQLDVARKKAMDSAKTKRARLSIDLNSAV